MYFLFVIFFEGRTVCRERGSLVCRSQVLCADYTETATLLLVLLMTTGKIWSRQSTAVEDTEFYNCTFPPSATKCPSRTKREDRHVISVRNQCLYRKGKTFFEKVGINIQL